MTRRELLSRSLLFCCGRRARSPQDPGSDHREEGGQGGGGERKRKRKKKKRTPRDAWLPIKTRTVTPKTSRLGGTNLLRIEGDVFFLCVRESPSACACARVCVSLGVCVCVRVCVCEFTGRGPHDLLKFACKWRHQPRRVPGASGPPRCQGKVNQPAAAQLSIDALYWDNTSIVLTCIVS